MDEKAIGAALGEGWSCRPQPGWQHRFYLSGPGGILLHIREEGQRVQVTGSIPYDPRLARRWREPKITVAATRSADVIAKEIHRRLLPQLREQMAEWTSARDREDEWDSERDRVADDLVALAAGSGLSCSTAPAARSSAPRAGQPSPAEAGTGDASLEPRVTQPRRADTIEELRAMEARGEIIGMTGLPLALRLCPYCRFFGTLGETCPASLRCP